MAKLLVTSAVLACFFTMATGALAADKLNVDGDGDPAWPGTRFAPHEVEFICVNNPHMSDPFRLRITDDIHRSGEKLRCRDFAPFDNAFLDQLRNNGRSALWVLTPTLARIFRDIDFHYAIDRIRVRSYRSVRFGVLAVDLSNRSCATGRFDDKIYDTEFSLKPNNEIPIKGIIRNEEESPGHIDVELSSIHSSGRAILKEILELPLYPDYTKEDLCESLLNDNFDLNQQAWISGERSAIEHRLFVFQDYIEEMKSLVFIHGCRNPETGDGVGGGTGFFVDDKSQKTKNPEESHFFLTNYHVVKCRPDGLIAYSTIDWENIKHFYNDVRDVNKSFYGVVVYYDERRDLALVRGAIPGPPLKIHDGAYEVKVADEVLALGHPRGVEYYTTKGIVSRIAMNCELPKDLEDNTKSSSAPIKCIQTDAAINPGNSGGPLLAENIRNVIGVNTFIAAWGKGAIVFPGLSWAIHYEEIRSFLEEAGVFEPRE